MQPCRGEIDDDRDRDDEVAREGDASHRTERGDRVGEGAEIETNHAAHRRRLRRIDGRRRRRKRLGLMVGRRECRRSGTSVRSTNPTRWAAGGRRGRRAPAPRRRPTMATPTENSRIHETSVAPTPTMPTHSRLPRRNARRDAGDCARRAIATPIATPRSPVTVARSRSDPSAMSRIATTNPASSCKASAITTANTALACARRPPRPSAPVSPSGYGQAGLGLPRGNVRRVPHRGPEGNTLFGCVGALHRLRGDEPAHLGRVRAPDDRSRAQRRLLGGVRGAHYRRGERGRQPQPQSSIARCEWGWRPNRTSPTTRRSSPQR